MVSDTSLSAAAGLYYPLTAASSDPEGMVRLIYYVVVGLFRLVWLYEPRDMLRYVTYSTVQYLRYGTYGTVCTYAYYIYYTTPYCTAQRALLRTE